MVQCRCNFSLNIFSQWLAEFANAESIEREGGLCLQKWWGQKPSLTSTRFFIYLKWLETDQEESLADKRRSCKWRGGLASEAAWSNQTYEQLHHYWMTLVSGGTLGMCEVTPNGTDFTSPASHSEGNRCQGCFQLADPVLPGALIKSERLCPLDSSVGCLSTGTLYLLPTPSFYLHPCFSSLNHIMSPIYNTMNFNHQSTIFSSTQKVPANCIFDKKLISGIQRTPAIQPTKLKWQGTWLDISPMKIHKRPISKGKDAQPH